MLSDEQFDALDWRELKDLKKLEKTAIEEIEPVWAGYCDEKGERIISGLLLYIRGNDGKKSVIQIDAEAAYNGSIFIGMSPARI